jgi:hypothetical protein
MITFTLWLYAIVLTVTTPIVYCLARFAFDHELGAIFAGGITLAWLFLVASVFEAWMLP